MRTTGLLSVIVLLLLVTSCGKSSLNGSPAESSRNSQPSLTTLPTDSLQSGEQLDHAGKVIPVTARHSSQLPLDAPFAAGAESFMASPDVVTDGGAARLTAPAGGISYTVYRFAMGGPQPATVAVDANVQTYGEGLGAYWVGVSNYGAGRWDWHGPFTESQVTFALAQGGNFTSPLGNAFVAIAVHDGVQIEMVGTTVTPQSGDTTAPPALSTAPQLTPANGGLELQWLPVIAGDLAGYKVYYSYSPFSAATSTGVKALPWLENTTRLFLPGTQTRQTWVGISAVDKDGNEGPLSPVASARQLPSGYPGVMEVSISAPTAQFGTTVSLSYGGADSFDLDLNGDGNFEITGVPAGNQTITADSVGILRPRVRGTSNGGTAVAFGSVSLLVPAEASLDITPAAAPIGTQVYLHLNLPGAATGVEWDLDGDGTFETSTAAKVDTTTTYSTPGYYIVAAHATYQGMQLTATRPALVQGWRRTLPAPSPGQEGFGASLAMVSGKPAISYIVEDAGYTNPQLTYIRASDPEGKSWGSPVTVNVPGGYASNMQVINGKPAIACFDGSAHLVYVHATNASGSTWASDVMLDPGQTTLTNVSLVQLQSVPPVPAVAYYAYPGHALVYIRAADPDGSTWNGAQVIDNSETECGISPVMRIVDGNPAVAYQNFTAGQVYYSQRYIRAADDKGLTWGTSELLLGASGSSSGVTGRSDFIVCNGVPEVAAVYEYTAAPNVYYIYYLYGNDSVGSSWSSTILYQSTFITGALQLTSVAAVPVMCFQAGSTNYAIRAGDPNGSFWQVPFGSDNMNYLSIGEVNGSPAMTGYSTTGINSDLIYSRLY